MSKHLSIQNLAFFSLFSMEFSYYLLILQTGLVEVHGSQLSEIWMLPFGGTLGILSTIFLYHKRALLVPSLLFLQLLISLNYSNLNGLEMFILGVISGVTAPLLIARIDNLLIAVGGLALSYLIGTEYIFVAASQREDIAIVLSLFALVASLMSKLGKERVEYGSKNIFQGVLIFFWIFLDSALFETLSRDAVMAIWANGDFTLHIMIFHLFGVVAAYKFRDFKHNNTLMVLLFTAAISAYMFGEQNSLSIIYPFVISYYNVIILNAFMKFNYPSLAILALGLWIASGAGLIVALSHSFGYIWIAVSVLLILTLRKNMFKLILAALFVSSFANASDLKIKSGAVEAKTEVFGDSKINPSSKNIVSHLHMQDGIETIEGSVSVSLVDLQSENKDRDKKMYETLDVAKYVQTNYTFKKVQKSQNGYFVLGELDLHGVKKDFTLNGEIEQSEGKIAMHLNGSFNMSDFGIEPPSLLFLTVRDLVEISVDIVMDQK